MTAIIAIAGQFLTQPSRDGLWTLLMRVLRLDFGGLVGGVVGFLSGLGNPQPYA